MKRRKFIGCTLIVFGLFIASGTEENLLQGFASLVCMVCAAALLGAFKNANETTMDARKMRERTAASEAA